MTRTRWGLVTERPPKTWELDCPRARGERAPTSPARGADINAQLAQAREPEAKHAEEYRAVRLL
jgi:hypothetical protein